MNDSPTALEQLSLDLITIPSVIGNEAQIADFVEGWGKTRQMHRVTRAVDNVAIQPRAFRPGAKRILLLGHLDTVTAPNGPRLLRRPTCGALPKRLN